MKIEVNKCRVKTYLLPSLVKNMLDTFLERKKSGEVDYSKPVERDGLKYVDLGWD